MARKALDKMTVAFPMIASKARRLRRNRMNLDTWGRIYKALYIHCMAYRSPFPTGKPGVSAVGTFVTGRGER